MNKTHMLGQHNVDVFFRKPSIGNIQSKLQLVSLDGSCKPSNKVRHCLQPFERQSVKEPNEKNSIPDPLKLKRKRACTRVCFENAP